MYVKKCPYTPKQSLSTGANTSQRGVERLSSGVRVESDYLPRTLSSSSSQRGVRVESDYSPRTLSSSSQLKEALIPSPSPPVSTSQDGDGNKNYILGGISLMVLLSLYSLWKWNNLRSTKRGDNKDENKKLDDSQQLYVMSTLVFGAGAGGGVWYMCNCS